jgi:hypothetical protein
VQPGGNVDSLKREVYFAEHVTPKRTLGAILWGKSCSEIIRNDARIKTMIRKAPIESVHDPKSSDKLRHLRWAVKFAAGSRPGRRCAWFGIIQPDSA